MQRFLGDKANK